MPVLGSSKDVINRLNSLRGKGMTSMYSWSSKRSYKNGFVWHDLSENDYIYPVHGQEYVLKGSELMQAQEQTIISSEKLPQIQRSNDEEECNFQVVTFDEEISLGVPLIFTNIKSIKQNHLPVKEKRYLKKTSMVHEFYALKIRTNSGYYSAS
ncbi:hypothetical protein IFM89_019867 [Coptis chinensis]|uniref:SOSEKI DIX-like domain-containing protein n=1 Tax=Coptis chinensis TaxID=261450 RepID=A0A835IX79_9MAGN|nr:hypothetical protein IFM89_019867 [Coptis chinensis]